MKTCTKCKQEKSLDYFSKDKRTIARLNEIQFQIMLKNL